MNGFAATVVRLNTHQSKTVARNAPSAKVNVEVGTGAIAPKVAIKRARSAPPVRVEVGTGAIAPKVAIKRARVSQKR